MDVESFKLSVTDPILPLPPSLFFSPTLIFQLWESNFPVTHAENNNNNRGCSSTSPLTIPTQPLSRAQGFCVWLLSPSSFPLALLGSGSHSHFLPICSQSTSIFFLYHCQFCPSVSHCSSQTSGRGTSVHFTFDSSHWAQPGTNHMLSDCCTEQTITLQKFSGPQLLIRSRQAKGLDFNRLAPTSPFYCFHTLLRLTQELGVLQTCLFHSCPCVFAHVFSFA